MDLRDTEMQSGFSPELSSRSVKSVKLKGITVCQRDDLGSGFARASGTGGLKRLLQFPPISGDQARNKNGAKGLVSRRIDKTSLEGVDGRSPRASPSNEDTLCCRMYKTRVTNDNYATRHIIVNSASA